MGIPVKDKAAKIFEILLKEYPDAKIALNFSNPLELLVATVLSAQCTDKKVNEVTSYLFKKYKTAEDYAKANIRVFQKEIKPTGFYRAKARNIIKMAKMLVKNYNSAVPKSMDELMKLPGVARKTANIVLGNAYGIVEGIPVDTHVHRLSQKLGLTKNTDPVKIEQDLMNLLPKEKWFKFPYLLIEHGRKICQAKKPLCNECVLSKLCVSSKKCSTAKK